MKLYFEERLAVLVLLGTLLAAALWRVERTCPRAFLPGGAGEVGTIAVTVAGAVARPGLHRVRRGARGGEAAAAAGPAAGADPGAVDRRLPLADGEAVYVPGPGETVAEQERRREEALRRSRRPVCLKPLDPNLASAEELARIPGVGEKLARAILLERARGPFERAEDLRRVPGIGAKKFEALRGHVAVGGAK
jgi:competence protein ComEA